MKSKQKRNKTSRLTMAQTSDRHRLYQTAVQDPQSEVPLIARIYKKLRGRPPLSLREDFCGTAYLSVQWCKSNSERTAIGVDLCEETLRWGEEHNVRPAGPSIARRVSLVHGNVLSTRTAPVDLACAFNFSYNCFKSRATLLEYLEAVRRGLKPDGMLVMDVYGGTEAMDVTEEERDVEGENFSYVWEQEKFDPITHDMLCHIHFNFSDGSRLDKAFSYDWRLWTLPELRELLTEAGFSKIHVFWEVFKQGDKDSEYLESTGRYKEVSEVENQESWVSYVFAER